MLDLQSVLFRDFFNFPFLIFITKMKKHLISAIETYKNNQKNWCYDENLPNYLTYIFLKVFGTNTLKMQFTDSLKWERWIIMHL